MSVGGAAGVADGAEEVGLARGFAGRAARVGVEGVAQGFAVEREGLVMAAVLGVPTLQGAVELRGVHAHQHVADDELAGHFVAAVAVPAAEPFAGARGEVADPLGHGLVAARAAQGGGGGQRQHRGQGVAPALGAARVVDVIKKRRQGAHVVGG